MLDKWEDTFEKKPSEVTVLTHFLELLLASLFWSLAIFVYTIFDGNFSMMASLFPFTFPNIFIYSFIAMLITSAVASAILTFKRK